MTADRSIRTVPISEAHDLTDFDCGVPVLNEWLNKRAFANDRSGASRTYVLCREATVTGYYCLSTGAIDHSVSPNQLRRNMPNPIPVVVLGRLAVDLRFQHQRLGSLLVRDAILRSVEVAKIAGAVALVVHALSDEARRFYLSLGFSELPLQPMTLFLLMRTAELAGASPASN
jgi:GNAT superfamily N-acetyltransferase